jgi:predicted nuclease with TOPRIM domain
MTEQDCKEKLFDLMKENECLDKENDRLEALVSDLHNQLSKSKLDHENIAEILSRHTRLFCHARSVIEAYKTKSIHVLFGEIDKLEALLESFR